MYVTYVCNCNCHAIRFKFSFWIEIRYIYVFVFFTNNALEQREKFIKKRALNSHVRLSAFFRRSVSDFLLYCLFLLVPFHAIRIKADELQCHTPHLTQLIWFEYKVATNWEWMQSLLFQLVLNAHFEGWREVPESGYTKPHSWHPNLRWMLHNRPTVAFILLAWKSVFSQPHLKKLWNY